MAERSKSMIQVSVFFVVGGGCIPRVKESDSERKLVCKPELQGLGD